MLNDLYTKLNDLYTKMELRCYPKFMARRLTNLVNELTENHVHCVGNFLNMLSSRIENRQDYLDILMEGRFAVILARHGFTEIRLECSKRKKGPDIVAVYNGEIVNFEITRRRPNECESRLAEQGVAQFVEPDKKQNIVSKILDEISQLPEEEINVVVLWSDTIRLGVSEVKEAFRLICKEIENQPSMHHRLSAVLFTEGSVDMVTGKQFHLFLNKHASRRVPDDIAQTLQTLIENSLTQLQQERDNLAKALVRRSVSTNGIPFHSL